jgi:4-hydroxy-tetrahydrodipicolinate synthase
LVIKTVIDQVAGRVPVVVNTGAQANVTAVLASQTAEELGADAVMCIAPASGLSGTEIRAYFKAISDSVSVSVFIQDVAQAPVPAALMRQIADESERVRYAKVESPPQAGNVQRAVALGAGQVTVFGGAGGMFLLEELRRGSAGTMPWPSTPHAFVAVWNHWHSGDLHAAREVFERDIAPLNRLASTGLGVGHRIHKEVLRRRGVIACANVRAPSDPLDEVTLRELDEIVGGS